MIGAFLRSLAPFRAISFARSFPCEAPSYPYPERYLTIEGKRICYIEVGTGEPLVFLHGSLDSLAIWLRNIPEFSKRFKVYALDFPGFGKSDREVADVSVEAMTLCLRQFIHALGLRDPHLVGCSMGGHVALKYALSGGGTGKIVLAAAAGISNPSRGFFKWILQYGFTPFLMGAVLYRYTFKLLWNQQFFESNEITDEVARHTLFYRSASGARERLRFVKTLVENIQSVLHDTVLDEIHKIERPVLFLWGDHNYYHPLSHGKRALREIRGSRLEVIPRSGHFTMIESASDFNRLALNFLS